MEQLDALADRFRAAGREFEKTLQRCEEEAESWRWASSDLYNLRPYEYERSGHARGRWLKKPPDLTKPNASPSHYGLNAQGDPVVERRYFWGSSGLYERLLFVRKPDYWEELHFDGAKKWPVLMDLERVEVREGRPVSAAWYAKHQKGYEEYTYEGERLVRADAVWSNQPFSPKQLLKAHWDLTYAETGELATITIHYEPTPGHPGGSFPAYPRARK